MLISTLETLLNRGLPRSPRAQALCGELAGCRLAVRPDGFAPLVLACDGTALRVSRDGGEVQAAVSGGLFSLLSLGAGDTAAAQRGGARITGDAAVARKFRELALLLRPDLEEELAQVIGDAPAHRLARLARAAGTFGRRAAGTAARNLAEFLAHESRDLVSQPEARSLLTGIDTLREHTDRLAARIALLERRPAAGSAAAAAAGPDAR